MTATRFCRPFVATTLAALVGAAAFSFATLAVSTASEAAEAKPASACKGLDQPTCGGNATCQWMPERVAGITVTKAGKPAKSSAKAHCRPAGKNAAQKAAQKLASGQEG